ncbi:MAG: bifunctional DNA-formamidopyrimidine glycosylase/DNA-(apurinic or apyrimidinic site) lyase [Bdellovibrio sp.]|jgi:formamidopyrimidine-DNA glycosylase
MPELPEVEVVRRSLTQIFKDQPLIQKVTWSRPDLRFALPLAFLRTWKATTISSVERRAKYLLLNSDKGSLVCHLGMTGSFRLLSHPDDAKTHDHVQFHLKDGLSLVFNDPRRFGFFLKWPGSWDQVTREQLGPEPLSDDFRALPLKKLLKGKAAPVKNILMDQKNVVGIGNIYASEVLHRAGVRPGRKASEVTLAECERIVAFSKEILLQAIEKGGSSIRDFHSPDLGEGSFQKAHLVYGREGEVCERCQTKIKRSVLGGRSTFWCTKCQR